MEAFRVLANAGVERGEFFKATIHRFHCVSISNRLTNERTLTENELADFLRSPRPPASQEMSTELPNLRVVCVPRDRRRLAISKTTFFELLSIMDADEWVLGLWMPHYHGLLRNTNRRSKVRTMYAHVGPYSQYFMIWTNKDAKNGIRMITL
jgi:hypothetical protein